MLIGGINNVSQTLASVYNQNNRIYAETLSRIASGKKIQRPSDDFAGFVRAQTMKTDVSGFEIVERRFVSSGLQFGRGLFGVFVNVGHVGHCSAPP